MSSKHPFSNKCISKFKLIQNQSRKKSPWSITSYPVVLSRFRLNKVRLLGHSSTLYNAIISNSCGHIHKTLLEEMRVYLDVGIYIYIYIYIFINTYELINKIQENSCTLEPDLPQALLATFQPSAKSSSAHNVDPRQGNYVTGCPVTS